MSMKQQLINEVLTDARWREGSSGSTPSREDPRNAAAAAACYEIIRYLEGPPTMTPGSNSWPTPATDISVILTTTTCEPLGSGSGVDHPRTLPYGSTHSSQVMPAPAPSIVARRC